MNATANDVQRISYPNENTYEGEISNGMVHGYGKKIFPDGARSMKDSSKTTRSMEMVSKFGPMETFVLVSLEMD